jgi:membrane-bound serine protease (ClpP class)
VILILFGIVLFIVDLHVISHGLLTAGGIVTLLAGGLALLGAGVPYSGVLLGALVVVAMLMGACSSEYWVRCAPSEVSLPSPARRE